MTLSWWGRYMHHPLANPYLADVAVELWSFDCFCVNGTTTAIDSPRGCIVFVAVTLFDKEITTIKICIHLNVVHIWQQLHASGIDEKLFELIFNVGILGIRFIDPSPS